MTDVETGPVLPAFETVRGWAQLALDELRLSSGYKTTKKQNPKQFGSTHMGRCEALLIQVVEGL